MLKIGTPAKSRLSILKSPAFNVLYIWHLCLRLVLIIREVEFLNSMDKGPRDIHEFLTRFLYSINSFRFRVVRIGKVPNHLIAFHLVEKLCPFLSHLTNNSLLEENVVLR